MRNLMFRLGAAVLVAGVLALTATPASAVAMKNCWAHQDTDVFLADGTTPNPNFGLDVAVWANGGGHDKHALALLDDLLGETESYAACVTLYNGGN